MTPDSKSVFISYGHKDGYDFVRRFAFSLEMYVDVFWDRKLRDGAFDKQLIDEIEKCNYLIIIMTPYALREDGWCRIEIDEAIKYQKPIVPIKLHDRCGFPDMEKMLERNQYADFRNSFDAGFQQLTQILLGQPFLSWEFFTHLSDKELIRQLEHRRIPNVIAFEIAEWVLVVKAWGFVQLQLLQNDNSFYESRPKTFLGILRSCKILLQQASIYNDILLAKLALDIEKITEEFIEKSQFKEDTNNENVNETYSLIGKIFDLLKLNSSGQMDVHQFLEVDAYYHFEVAEKLRELINLHARRSRYLY